MATREIDIHKSVLLDIAATTLEGIEGSEVAQAPLKMGEVLRQQASPSRRPKAIKVVRENQDVTVEIGINVEYGRSLIGVAAEAQQALKENIELMTGLNVKAVDVSVQDIYLPEGQAS